MFNPSYYNTLNSLGQLSQFISRLRDETQSRYSLPSFYTHISHEDGTPPECPKVGKGPFYNNDLSFTSLTFLINSRVRDKSDKFKYSVPFSRL